MNMDAPNNIHTTDHLVSWPKGHLDGVGGRNGGGEKKDKGLLPREERREDKQRKSGGGHQDVQRP